MRGGCTDVGTSSVCPSPSACPALPRETDPGLLASAGVSFPGLPLFQKGPRKGSGLQGWMQGVGLEGGYCAISFFFLDPAPVFVNSPFVKLAPKYYFEGPGP